MQYCKKCKISIRGHKACCPLCQGKVSGEPENPAFEVIVNKGMSDLSIFKICTFALVSLIVVMLAIELLLDFTLRWPIVIIVLGIFAYVDTLLAIYLRSNVINLVTIQGLVLVALIYGVDRYIRRYSGFSVAFVIPLVFMILPFVIWIIGRYQKLHTVDYAMNILIVVLLSLFQIIPIRTGNNFFPILAIISMGVDLIYFAYVIIFRNKDMKNAVTKYMNV